MLEEQQESGDKGAEEAGGSAVQQYRTILNDFFRLIAKLNQKADTMGYESEIFRVKLQNMELREQCQKAKLLDKAGTQVEKVLSKIKKQSLGESGALLFE